MPATRRRFLGFLTASSAGLFGLSQSGLPQLSAQESHDSQDSNTDKLQLIDSPPVLQCPSENSMTVGWAVNRQALGSVEFGTTKDKLDQTAFGERFGLKANHDRFLQIRLNNLKPNTRYYYRTITSPFVFHTGHRLEKKEVETVYSDIYSFETPGANKPTASFSVINDTHNNFETQKRVTARLVEIGYDYTIGNGDLVNSYDNADMAVETILRPGGSAYATEHPFLFVPGNHDHRGIWARNLPLAAATWNYDNPADRKLERNFVVRTGPLAIIGLDTGEDKPDWHPAWAGQAFFEPYRIAQREWLERMLKSPVVATAPFVVTFCHIPIFDSDPNANGGDVLEKWASFQRQAGTLWGPLLTQHGVQLVIAAHMHKYRCDEPTADRTWMQIVGGGNGTKGDVTVIHGKAEGDTLEVAVDELNSGKEIGRWKFPKRKI